MATMATSSEPEYRNPRRGIAAGVRAAALVALLLLNVSALLAGLIGTTPTTHAAAHPSSPSLDIVVPKPAADGVASGPADATISVSGVGTKGHTYQLGYATKSDTCSSSNVQQLSGQTPTAGSDGTFSATFGWPSGTNQGTAYYICASDTSPLATPLTPPIQSTQVFKPLTSDGVTPNIVITAIPPVNPTGATPAPTPPDGSYYADSQVTITGANFLPGHSTLWAYVTVGSAFGATDTTTYRPLAVQGGGTTFTSQNNGAFAVTVTLPLQPQGHVYFHVVSADSTKTFPPSVDVSQQIVLLAPLPTPTPATPTVSTTPSPSTTVGGGGNNSTPNPSNVLAVIGLSGLSIILFVVGIILMTSAGAMPRAQR